MGCHHVTGDSVCSIHSAMPGCRDAHGGRGVGGSWRPWEDPQLVVDCFHGLSLVSHVLNTKGQGTRKRKTCHTEDFTVNAVDSLSLHVKRTAGSSCTGFQAGPQLAAVVTVWGGGGRPGSSCPKTAAVCNQKLSVRLPLSAIPAHPGGTAVFS